MKKLLLLSLLSASVFASSTYEIRIFSEGVTEPINYKPSSCKNIKTFSPTAPSGVYKLTITNKQISVYCDMTNDDGGWTLVMRGKGGDTAGWATAGALKPENAGQSNAPTGATFKLSDADINEIRGSQGIYRLTSDGLSYRTRFLQAHQYGHTTVISSHSERTVSYSTQNWASPKYGFINNGRYFGFTDDSGLYSSFFTTNYSMSRWLIGDGETYGGPPSASSFCGGETAGCSMAMWVK